MTRTIKHILLPSAAVVDPGVSVATVGLFERGPVESVEYFIKACEDMTARFDRAEPLRLPVLERV